MATHSTVTKIHYQHMGIIAGFLCMMFFLSITTSFAATTATLYPTSDGNYVQWTPNAGATHYTQVDETACNGVIDYVSTDTLGNRDSYGISVSTIPDGSTITQIRITPCASRNHVGNSSTTMKVFYRYNGIDSADSGAFALSGTSPAGLYATNFSSLVHAKNLGSTLEIGAVYASGTTGVRLGRVAVIVTYTPPVPTVTTYPATNIDTTSVILKGVANPNGKSSTGWFRYSTTNPGTCNDSFGTRAPNTGGTVLGSGLSSIAYSSSVSGLVANTRYYVCALASSSGGTSAGIVRNFVTFPIIPNAPTGTLATNVSGTENNISWTDTSSNEVGFKIERSVRDGSTSDGFYTEIATTTANVASYRDTSVRADDTYTYRVRSYTLGGDSSYSTSNYVITATMVPVAPSINYFAVGASSTPPDVLIGWTSTGANQDGFRIERSTDNVNFTVIATPSFDSHFYFDTAVPSGTYYYRISAFNVIGNSGYSSTKIALVP